jgi:hypothetical protein
MLQEMSKTRDRALPFLRLGTRVCPQERPLQAMMRKNHPRVRQAEDAALRAGK